MNSEEGLGNFIEKRIDKLGEVQQNHPLAAIGFELLGELIQMRMELSAAAEAINALAAPIHAAAAPELRYAPSSTAGGRLRKIVPLEFVPIGSGASQFD